MDNFMSNAVLKGNASGTGTVTLETPNTNTDRTISFPDATCNMAYEDSSGNLQVNSGYGSKATAYGCRAWVNFNGTGTVAIRASGNVSSITDLDTGHYRVNFTNAMPDANWCAEFSGGDGTYTTSAPVFIMTATPTTASCSFAVNLRSTGNPADYAFNYVAIFR